MNVLYFLKKSQNMQLALQGLKDKSKYITTTSRLQSSKICIILVVWHAELFPPYIQKQLGNKKTLI